MSPVPAMPFMPPSLGAAAAGGTSAGLAVEVLMSMPSIGSAAGASALAGAAAAALTAGDFHGALAPASKFSTASLAAPLRTTTRQGPFMLKLTFAVYCPTPVSTKVGWVMPMSMLVIATLAVRFRPVAGLPPASSTVRASVLSPAWGAAGSSVAVTVRGAAAGLAAIFMPPIFMPAMASSAWASLVSAAVVSVSAESIKTVLFMRILNPGCTGASSSRATGAAQHCG